MSNYSIYQHYIIERNEKKKKKKKEASGLPQGIEKSPVGKLFDKTKILNYSLYWGGAI